MSTIREIQLCSLEILKEVTHVCQRHHLRYYLSSGTLLGAVRHDGFIPWDDDIDIEIPVEDYRKFLKYAKQELPSQYFVQTFVTDPGYSGMWAKVRMNGTTSMPVACQGLHIHFGIGIDIFPLTGIYETPFLRKMQAKFCSVCRMLIARDYILATGCDDIEANKKIKLAYSVPRGIRIAIASVLEKLVWKSTKKSRIVSMIADDIVYFMEGKDYHQTEKHLFEDTEMCIPGGYDHILTALYGDYMTPPPATERNQHENMLGTIIYECDRDYHQFLK